MRNPAIPALLLVLAALPVAQAQDGRLATLDITVGADRAEAMKLTFDGLERLTRYHGICLPEGARETRVYDSIGDVPYDGTEEDGRRIIAFTARSEKLFVEMSRPGPAASEHPLYSADVNFCVPADTFVRVSITVPEDHTLFFLSDGGSIERGRQGTTTSHGPTHVFYSYEAPIGSASLKVFDEGPFRAFVEPASEDEARVVVGLAADPYDASLAAAGLPRPFDTLRIRFVQDTPFAWEAGHYNGQGYVTVKETALAEKAAEGFPYVAVKVIVHEGFHAASLPYGKGDVDDPIAWWLEGTARHAERQVDRAMPNATIHCARNGNEVRCASFDDRIARADLDTGYTPNFTFDPAWEPSREQTEDTRRFYYAFSEFLVAAWIAQNGQHSYNTVWDTITTAFEDETACPCPTGWLAGLLAAEHLYRPWDDLRTTDAGGFEARVTPFVKDERALNDALDANSNPLSGLGVPLAPWVAIVALLGVALWGRGR